MRIIINWSEQVNYSKSVEVDEETYRLIMEGDIDDQAIFELVDAEGEPDTVEVEDREMGAIGGDGDAYEAEDFGAEDGEI